MEAKKPHNLLTRKAGGIIQFESKGMRTRLEKWGKEGGHCRYRSWTLKALGPEAPMAKGGRRRTF